MADGKLGPGDQAQLVGLHHIRMRGDNTDTEAVGAAFRRGHCSLVQITAVTVAAAWIQNRNRRIFDSTVLGFAMIRLDAHVVWIDIAKKNVSADFERFADLNVLSV